MKKEQILVIEDDQDTRELIRIALEKESYQINLASTAGEGLKNARANVPDLMLLDLMLPDQDGLDVFRSLKKDVKTAHIPVIMLTARDQEADIVSGLELGADDYITKPFRPRVLVARLKAVLRRKRKEPLADDSEVRIHNILIHPGRHDVQVSGKSVHLTLSEFRILHLLARKPGWVFTRYQIVDSIRSESTSVTERSVDVLIVGLRRKLGSDAGKLIETVHGVGYRFREEEKDDAEDEED